MARGFGYSFGFQPVVGVGPSGDAAADQRPGGPEVIYALHQAAPELLAKVLRAAWERAGGGAS